MPAVQAEAHPWLLAVKLVWSHDPTAGIGRLLYGSGSGDALVTFGALWTSVALPFSDMPPAV